VEEFVRNVLGKYFVLFFDACLVKDFLEALYVYLWHLHYD